MQRVLVLGGYGAFGGLAAERLARVAGIEVIVAGRSGAKAESFAARRAAEMRAISVPPHCVPSGRRC